MLHYLTVIILDLIDVDLTLICLLVGGLDQETFADLSSFCLDHKMILFGLKFSFQLGERAQMVVIYRMLRVYIRDV
jgi:hypothetical protein